MAVDAQWVEELFAPFGPVRLRRMFSGYGVYAGDLCIALMLGGGSLCLRCDAHVRAAYEALGARPFSYEKQGRRVSVDAWWVMPDVLLDEPEELARRARLSLEIARARPPKRKRAPKAGAKEAAGKRAARKAGAGARG